MDIKQENFETKGAFYAYKEGVKAGEITYAWAGNDKIILDHTGVDEAFKGQSVGLQLVHAAVEYARKNELKIIPLCPFAKSVFDKNTELRDVLA